MNRWWENVEAERFWMEITDRDRVGSNLHAPQVDDAGNAYWGYNLLTEVLAGDVVLHWHKSLRGEAAIVGWSRAAGPAEETEIVWQAQGTSGRNAPTSGPEPAWLVPLIDFSPLVDPVSQSVVRGLEPQLRGVKADLEAEHGSPLYFPFAFSSKRPARAAQGYLVKFPAELIKLFDGMRWVPRPDVSGGKRGVVKRRTTAGWQRDPRVRTAVERRAVDLAIQHYRDKKYLVENVGSFRSYDLHVTRGDETRHVEVKGSSTATFIPHSRPKPTSLSSMNSKWSLIEGSVSQSR